MVGWGLLWCRPVLGLHGAAVPVGGLFLPPEPEGWSCAHFPKQETEAQKLPLPQCWAGDHLDPPGTSLFSLQ